VAPPGPAVDAGADPRSGVAGGLRRGAGLGVKVAGVAALLLAWFLASAGGVLDPHSVPGPVATLRALVAELGRDRFWGAIGDTMTAWALGLGIGSSLGLLLGTGLAVNRFADRSAAAVVEFFKTVPVIAVLPLAILVLGTALPMKVALVAFGVTWPLLVQTSYGVKSMDPVIRDTATALGVGRVRRFFVVVLPSASPFIATGLRVAAASALTLTIVTELIAGGSGLGVEISTAAVSGIQALPTMYARILAAGLLGVTVALLVSAIERRLLRWHDAYRPERP
jgi:ABC-type nitrate/sulfonate/bicarbonate transport system permease component